MTRATWLPYAPAEPLGASKQTSGEWLTSEMERRRLSNLELYRRLQARGFAGTSVNIISLWRTDKTAIAPETLPLLLEALDVPMAERRQWAGHFLRALHPTLASLVLDPSHPSLQSQGQQ